MFKIWVSFLVQGGLQQWHHIVIFYSVYTRLECKILKLFCFKFCKIHFPLSCHIQITEATVNSTRHFRNASLFDEDRLMPSAQSVMLLNKAVSRYNMRGLKLSQQRCWRFRSSWMRRYVDWYIVTDVSKDRTAFFFGILDCLNLNMKELRFLETSVTIYIWHGVALHKTWIFKIQHVHHWPSTSERCQITGNFVTICWLNIMEWTYLTTLTPCLKDDVLFYTIEFEDTHAHALPEWYYFILHYYLYRLNHTLRYLEDVLFNTIKFTDTHAHALPERYYLILHY